MQLWSTAISNRQVDGLLAGLAIKKPLLTAFNDNPPWWDLSAEPLPRTLDIKTRVEMMSESSTNVADVLDSITMDQWREFTFRTRAMFFVLAVIATLQATDHPDADHEDRLRQTRRLGDSLHGLSTKLNGEFTCR